MRYVRYGLAIVLGITALSSPALAQRGMGGGGMGGGMGGRRGGEMGRGGRMPEIKFPSAKTLEKYNPAALMLDKSRKLALSDSQTTMMKALRQRIYERNAPLLARYDSLQRDFRPPRMNQRDMGAGGAAGAADDSTRRVAMQQMRQLRTLLDTLQERRRTDVREVLEALADNVQRRKAAVFLDEQDVAFNEELPAAGPPGEGEARFPRGRAP